MNKDEAFRTRSAWAFALQSIAHKYGPASSIYRAMGTIAWGRYECEPCSTDSKERAVEAIGYLRGMRDALLRASEIAGWHGAAEDLRNVYDVVLKKLTPR